MAILYQKRGNEFVPVEIPAETVSVVSDKFQATEVQGALEEVLEKQDMLLTSDGIKAALLVNAEEESNVWDFSTAYAGYATVVKHRMAASEVEGFPNLDQSMISLSDDRTVFTIEESGVYDINFRGMWHWVATSAPQTIEVFLQTVAEQQLHMASSTSGKNASMSWYQGSMIQYFNKGDKLRLVLCMNTDGLKPYGNSVSMALDDTVIRFNKLSSLNALDKNKFSGGDWCLYHYNTYETETFDFFSHKGDIYSNLIKFGTPNYIKNDKEHKSWEVIENGIHILQDGQYFATLTIEYDGVKGMTDEKTTGCWLNVLNKNILDNRHTDPETAIATLYSTSLAFAETTVNNQNYIGEPYRAFAVNLLINVKAGQVIIPRLWLQPELSIRIAAISFLITRIVEPATVQIAVENPPAQEVSEYSWSEAEGGKKGLIPDIPRANVTFPGQALRVDMNITTHIEESEYWANGPDQGSSTGTIHYKSGYTLAEEHGVRRHIYEQAYVRNPNDQGDHADYKILAAVENKKQIRAFSINMNDGTEGLHWYDSTTGAEQVNRQIIRLAAGYSTQYIGDLSNVTIDKCVIGALVNYSSYRNILPNIGTWDVVTIVVLIQNGLKSITDTIHNTMPGGAVIQYGNQGSHLSIGWARRVL